MRPASLDAPVGEDGDSATFGEIVGDDNAMEPLRRVCATRTRTPTCMRHGRLARSNARRRSSRCASAWTGSDELTLEEVGKKFHVTRERIRQLEYLALTKMRKAMAKNEEVRTVEEIDDERRQRERMAVIREFVESKTHKQGKAGRN